MKILLQIIWPFNHLYCVIYAMYNFIVHVRFSSLDVALLTKFQQTYIAMHVGMPIIFCEIIFISHQYVFKI
jgi:hypothetical protein